MQKAKAAENQEILLGGPAAVSWYLVAFQMEIKPIPEGLGDFAEIICSALVGSWRPEYDVLRPSNWSCQLPSINGVRPSLILFIFHVSHDYL
jgi:hypothetical protein